MDMRFRQASLQDYATTRALVDAAFNAEENVPPFLDVLRADGCLLGEWLVEDATGALGHVAFSRALLETPAGGVLSAAFLTPLAVRPDRQRQGLGLALMRFALRELDAAGERLYLVVGHPEYYPKAGFSAAAARAIDCPWRGRPAFMARGEAPPACRLTAPAAIIDAH
jgi:putative acetyltransferase